MTHKVGTGFDSHPMVAGRPCVLGGVTIPHPTGPAGHSDGDAVLHAVADALLGAAGLEDLGSIFPDGDPLWKDAPSAKLLREVARRVIVEGYKIVNIDVVVATDGPKIAPHRDAMRQRIGEILGIGTRDVNVKGKSLEGLAAAGSPAGTCVVAQSVCLLER